ncbi:MAG: DMT family transporter, partial [Comamonas sp.]
VELAVVALVMQDLPSGLNNSNILGLVLLAVALTAVPFALWFGAIERAGAVAVAPFMLLTPVTAFVLDALVKGVQPSNLQLVGAALVMGGLILSQRGSSKPHAHAHKHAHTPEGQNCEQRPLIH